MSGKLIKYLKKGKGVSSVHYCTDVERSKHQTRSCTENLQTWQVYGNGRSRDPTAVG